MAFPVREGWSWCPKMFNLKYWGGVNWALCSTQSIAHLPSFRELLPNTFFILSRAISVPVITPIMFTWKRALLASCKDEISIWQCYIYKVQGNCFNQFAVTEIRTSRDIYRYDIGHCDLWRRKNAQSGRRTSSTVKCKKYLTEIIKGIIGTLETDLHALPPPHVGVDSCIVHQQVYAFHLRHICAI